jgi:hypothetical protein
MIERAVRASCKAGMPPSSVECHPDGRIVLCFVGSNTDPDAGLDREMEQWKRSNGTG